MFFCRTRKTKNRRCGIGKSLLTKVLHAILSPPNEVWTSSQTESDKVYADLLKRARQRVKIVCGECDPRLFEQKRIIRAFDNLLERKGKVELVLGTLEHEENTEEVRKRLHKDNKRLSEVLSKHRKQVKVYVASQRPNLHYSVVDGKHVLFEEAHEPYKARETRTKFDDEKLGRSWEQRFEKYVKVKTAQHKLTTIEV